MIILCYILQKNQENFIDIEEAKKYPNEISLNLFVELMDFCEKIDIKKINFMLEKIKNIEKDYIIKDNFNEISRNLRINFLVKKLKIFRKVSFDYLVKEMESNRGEINGMINQIYETGLLQVILNLLKIFQYF